MLDLLGKSMACVCWQVQRQGYYDFAPVAGRQQTRAWNADRGAMPRCRGAWIELGDSPEAQGNLDGMD